MNRRATITLIAAALACTVMAAWRSQPEPPVIEGAPRPGVRFESVDVYLDAGVVPLAAYQVQIRALEGGASLVGIKGGDHPAYKAPPYYDPRALHEGQMNERVVIAAIGEDTLPVGRVHVASLQVALERKVEFEIIVQAAGDSQGERIDASADIQRRSNPGPDGAR